MRRTASLLPFLACLALLASCSAGTAPPLAVHVDWGLDGPAGALPSDVVSLEITVFTDDGAPPQSATNTVGGLMDRDGDGTRESILDNLPLDTEIRITVNATTSAGSVGYTGHAGPFMLRAGERRYVDLRMYSVGSFAMVPAGGITPRMLATATALGDGRVLVAGGFTRTASATCPAAYATATCFDLTAADDAYLVDVASGNVLPVVGGLGQARGGHTATLLPNGRVLLAGGSAHALLILAPTSGAMTFAPIFQALDTTGPAPSSFEVFVPTLNAEEEDVDRDGDPGRGGFVGAADDPTELGRLDSPRFLHAAIAVPGHASQVLLVGGLDSADTWSVYDDARAGGYGLLASSASALRVPRSSPALAVMQGAMGQGVWIIGGGAAASNADIAEVWTSTTAAPFGTTTMGVPASVTMDHPEWSLTGASALTLGESHAVVTGWLGPLCDPTSATPTLPTFTGGTELCNFPAPSEPVRNFTIDGMTGRPVVTTAGARHAFGASVAMSDGTGLVIGGLSDLSLHATNAVEHWSATVLATGSAQLTDMRPTLMQARAFHAAAPLDDRGAIVVGGLSVNTTGAAPSIGLVGTVEVVYLGR